MAWLSFYPQPLWRSACLHNYHAIVWQHSQKNTQKSNKQPNFGTWILKCFPTASTEQWCRARAEGATIYVRPFGFNIEYKKLHIIIPFACKKRKHTENRKKNTENFCLAHELVFRRQINASPGMKPVYTFRYVCEFCYVFVLYFVLWPAVSFDNRPIIVMQPISIVLCHTRAPNRGWRARSGPSKIIRNALKWKMCRSRFQHSPG